MQFHRYSHVILLFPVLFHRYSTPRRGGITCYSRVIPLVIPPQNGGGITSLFPCYSVLSNVIGDPVVWWHLAAYPLHAFSLLVCVCDVSGSPAFVAVAWAVHPPTSCHGLRCPRSLHGARHRRALTASRSIGSPPPAPNLPWPTGDARNRATGTSSARQDGRHQPSLRVGSARRRPHRRRLTLGN